jgi:hypothetical protein
MTLRPSPGSRSAVSCLVLHSEGMRTDFACLLSNCVCFLGSRSMVSCLVLHSEGMHTDFALNCVHLPAQEV